MIETRAFKVETRDDWLAPSSSLHFLLSKLPRCAPAVATIDATALGIAADHFSWMQQPQAIEKYLAE